MKTRRHTKPTKEEKKVNTKAGNCIRLFTTKPNTDTLLQIDARVKVYSCSHCDAIFFNESEYENHKESHPMGKLKSPGTDPSGGNQGSSVSDKQERLGTVTHKTASDEHASAAAHLLNSYPSTSQQKHGPAATPTITLSVTGLKNQQEERAPRVKSAPIIRQAEPVFKGPPLRKRTKEDDDPWGPSAWERRWGKEDTAPCTSNNKPDASGSRSSTQDMEVISERNVSPKKEIVVLKSTSSYKKAESSLQRTRPTKGEEVSQQSRSSSEEQNVSEPEILYPRPVMEYAASMQPDSLPSMPDHIEHSDTESEPDNAALEVKQEPGVDTDHAANVDPEEHAYTTSPLRGKLHNCPLCGKLFVDPAALKLHVLVHANNKSHVCNKCGKMYTLESNLIAHLKTHTDERPNTCVKCGLAFGSPVELRTHFKSHLFEKPYVCTYCDVGFATGPELTTHMKSSHTGKDRLKDAHCEQCGGPCQAKPKVFVDKSQKPYVVRIISQGTCKPISKPVEQAKKPGTIQPFKGISKSVDYEKCKVKGPLVIEEPEPMAIFPANEAAKEPYNKPYSCKYCGDRFHCTIDLRKHIRIHTGKNFHECTICLKRFFQITQLKRHIQTHTGEKPFNCVHCDKRFICNYDLTQHLLTHSNEKPFKCTLCKKVFSQKDQLVVHKWLKHNHRKLHLCVECGASFPVSWKLKMHVRNHTGEKLYQCTQCEAKFRTSTALRMHKMSHAGIKPHTCPYCEKPFLRVSSLKFHIRRHEGDKQYLCAVCGKAFVRSSELSKHARLHEGNKPYLCAVCGKAFVTQSSLNDHARRHSGVKPYKCTYGCGKSFYTASNLNSHIKIHASEKTNICPHCDKSFTQIGNLRFHIANIHDGRNRHHECDVCKKVFITDYLLQRHMGTHDTHPCKVCGNIFNTRGLLYKHMRNVHKMEINPSGKRPSVVYRKIQGQNSSESPALRNRHHECDVCKKVFVGDYLFQRHMGTHDTHQCDVCRKVFKSRWILYRHMRNIHEIEIKRLGHLGPHVNPKRGRPAESQGQQSLESSVSDNVVVIQPSDLHSQTDMYKPPISAQTIQSPLLQPRTDRSMIQFPAVRMSSMLQGSQERTSMSQSPQVLSEPSMIFSQSANLHISSSLEQTQMITHSVQAPHILSQSSSPYVQYPEPKLRQNELSPQTGNQAVHNQTSLPNPQTKIQIIHPHQICKKFVVQSSGSKMTSVTSKEPKGIQPSQIHNQCNKNTLNPQMKPYPIGQHQQTPQSSRDESGANSNPRVPPIRIHVTQPHGHPLPTHSVGKKPKTKACSECMYCRLQFDRTSDLVDHIKMHTGHNPHKCSVCGKAFITAAFLDRHQCIQ